MKKIETSEGILNYMKRIKYTQKYPYKKVSMEELERILKETAKKTLYR